MKLNRPEHMLFALLRSAFCPIPGRNLLADDCPSGWFVAIL